MLALLVTIKIKSAHREAFMDAMLGDARGSAYDEPGCLRFDVLQDAHDPHTIYLYEVYRGSTVLQFEPEVDEHGRMVDDDLPFIAKAYHEFLAQKVKGKINYEN